MDGKISQQNSEDSEEALQGAREVAEEPEASNRTEAAEKILQAASEMFYRDGIRAVGVDSIVEESGVTKMTLYKHFGSKDQLVAEYLRERDLRWKEWLRGALDRHSGSPRERILSIFDALAEWLHGSNGYRGCAFVNALVELADEEHPAHEVIREQKIWMREYLSGIAAETEIKDPSELSERLMLVYEGANVISVMQDGPQTARRAHDSAAAILTDFGL